MDQSKDQNRDADQDDEGQRETPDDVTGHGSLRASARLGARVRTESM
jgi:hypothetical protein